MDFKPNNNFFQRENKTKMEWGAERLEINGGFRKGWNNYCIGIFSAFNAPHSYLARSQSEPQPACFSWQSALHHFLHNVILFCIFFSPKVEGFVAIKKIKKYFNLLCSSHPQRFREIRCFDCETRNPSQNQRASADITAKLISTQSDAVLRVHQRIYSRTRFEIEIPVKGRSVLCSFSSALMAQSHFQTPTFFRFA